MEESAVKQKSLIAFIKLFARQLLVVCQNRIELLTVEAQEERQRFARAFLLALGVASLSILAGISVSAAIVFLLRPCSPVIILFSLAVLYTATAAYLLVRLGRMLRSWRSFPASLDQLKKDGECLIRQLE